jgi:hypothetical protein
MDNPHDARLIQLEKMLKEELPEFSVNRDPNWNIDVGGTFRLDRGKTPEHLIKLDDDVLDDYSPVEIMRQLRAQRLAQGLKNSSKQKVWIKPVQGGGIRVQFENWQL